MRCSMLLPAVIDKLNIIIDNLFIVSDFDIIEAIRMGGWQYVRRVEEGKWHSKPPIKGATHNKACILHVFFVFISTPLAYHIQTQHK